VNYCSFAYKSRYQAAASRHRCGLACRRPGEDLTANGFIRRLHVRGPAAVLRQQASRLAAAPAPAAACGPRACLPPVGAASIGVPACTPRPGPAGAPPLPAFELDPDAAELRLPQSLLGELTWDGCRLRVDYLAAHLVARLSYLHPFAKLELDSGTSLYVERRAAGGGLDLEPPAAAAFAAALAAACAPHAGPAPAPAESSAALQPVAELEFIEPGLQEYY
jgi:hypothetical protein